MKKGFTLIELLAVIVILAIIALIVTPVILNIIKNAQEGSDKRSIEQYAKIVKEGYLEQKLVDSLLTLDDYLINFASETTYDGDKIVCEQHSVVDKEIELKNCTVGGRGYYNYKNGKAVKGETVENNNTDNNQISVPESVDTENTVYFDVVEGSICEKTEYESSWDGNDYSNSYTGYNGISNITCSNKFNPSLDDCITDNELKMQNSCLKFYSFNDDGESVMLILDHNIISVPDYSESHTGPNGYKYLEQSTDFSLSFVMNLLENYSSSWKGVKKVRLLEFNEIAKITENTSWDETKTTSQYKFDSYDWLYDRIDYGYWISSNEWYVNSGMLNKKKYYSYNMSGGVITGDEIYSAYRAPITVRPVIEVSKSSISQ